MKNQNNTFVIGTNTESFLFVERINLTTFELIVMLDNTRITIDSNFLERLPLLLKDLSKGETYGNTTKEKNKYNIKYIKSGVLELTIDSPSTLMEFKFDAVADLHKQLEEYIHNVHNYITENDTHILTFEKTNNSKFNICLIAKKDNTKFKLHANILKYHLEKIIKVIHAGGSYIQDFQTHESYDLTGYSMIFQDIDTLEIRYTLNSEEVRHSFSIKKQTSIENFNLILFNIEEVRQQREELFQKQFKK